MGSWVIGRVSGSLGGTGQGPGNYEGCVSGKVVNIFCSNTRTQPVTQLWDQGKRSDADFSQLHFLHSLLQGNPCSEIR